MPEEDNKIRKYNNQSTKHQFIYADFKCLLKEISEHNPEKAYKKKLYIKLLVIQCLRVVHLMQQKISLIFIEVKVTCKDFGKT